MAELKQDKLFGRDSISHISMGLPDTATRLPVQSTSRIFRINLENTHNHTELPFHLHLVETARCIYAVFHVRYPYRKVGISYTSVRKFAVSIPELPAAASLKFDLLSEQSSEVSTNRSTLYWKFNRHFHMQAKLLSRSVLWGSQFTYLARRVWE